MTDDDLDEIEMAHRARLRAVLEADDLRGQVERLTTLLRLAEASVSLLRGDMKHTEWTWPDDFDDPLGDKPECNCAACGVTVWVEWGTEWTQGRDVCQECARMRSDALSVVTRERDAARLEIRRLRAAEAPGTDDEAVAPWVWDEGRSEWVHPGGPTVWRHCGVAWAYETDSSPGCECHAFALDAMRAAVPGSV